MPPEDDQNPNEQEINIDIGTHGYSEEDLDQFGTEQTISEILDAHESTPDDYEQEEDGFFEDGFFEILARNEQRARENTQNPTNEIPLAENKVTKKKLTDPQKYFRHALNINVKQERPEDPSKEDELTYEITIQLKVQEQPKEMTATENDFGPRLLFTASNGWRIITHSCVRILPREKEIHIIGRLKGIGSREDSYVFITGCPFPAVVHNIQEALMEFAEFANGEDVRIPNPNQSRYDALEIED